MVKILRKIWKNKKQVRTGILITALFLPRLAFAQTGNGALDEAAQGLLTLLSNMQEFLHSILWPILLMIGSLLQNDLLYGGGMEGKLLDIWVNIRNIVNIFFVLVLVGIAFYNVVSGGEGDSYQLKTFLPKFIIGLIAVNFSYLGIKVVLDGINIVATGIFALPNTVNTSLVIEADNGKAFCEGIYGTGQKYIDNVKKANQNKGTAFCKPQVAELDMGNPKIAEFFNTYNSRNAALVMALGVQKINLLNKVYVNKPTLKDLNLNFLLSTTLYIIYAASYVALLAVLLVRLIVLWLMIVLSPLIALKSVLPESLQGSLGGGEDIGKKFLQHAIVPIPIALVLSIGYILLDTMSKTRFSDQTLTFSTLNVNLLTSGIPTLQQLIAALGSVAFIWKGVFDASKDTYAASITDGIKGFVGGIGKFFGKLPKLIPAFPVAGGKTASLGEVMLAGQSLEHLPDTMIQQNFQKNFPWLSGGNQAGFATAIANKPTSVVMKELGNIATKNPLELEGAHVQKPLAEHLKLHPHDLKVFTTKYGTAAAFAKALEQGGVVTAAEMMEFLNKNSISTKGAPAIPVTTSTTAGATAGATVSGQDLAKKHGMNDDSLKALQNVDQLKGLAKLSAADETKLKNLATQINAAKPDEKAIQKALDPAALALLGNLTKINQGQIAATRTFDEAILNLQAAGGVEKNLTQTETAMKDEFKNLTGRDFKAGSTKPEDQEAIRKINAQVVGYFSDPQKASMAKASNKDSIITAVLNPPAPPAPKPAAGPAPVKGAKPGAAKTGGKTNNAAGSGGGRGGSTGP